jgi:DNA-binding NarL/FixJ family response regulator
MAWLRKPNIFGDAKIFDELWSSLSPCGSQFSLATVTTGLRKVASKLPLPPRQRMQKMQPAETIRVLIVEDHRMVAEGLEALLGATSDIRSVGVAGTVADAIRLDGAMQPDVILMDFRLPDGTGADATAQIRRQHRAVPVVFLGTDDGEDTLMAAVRAGGCGYLSKSQAATEVAAAVRRAAEGEMLIPATRLAGLLARAQDRSRDEAERGRLLADLTPREMEVLRLMADGLDNRAIADRLSISFTTVRGHVQHILEKLDAHSKLEAVARAAKFALLSG